MRRRKRKLQLTCTCSAYKFPHRLGGGKCRLSNFAERIYHGEELFITPSGDRPSLVRECNSCMCNVNYSCEVAEGIESAKYCESIIQLFSFNEVKL